MKTLLSTIVFLLSFNLLAQTLGPLEIQTENNGVQFECVIPGHGGGCTTEAATLLIKEDLPEFWTAMVINATTGVENGLSFKDLKKGKKIELALSLDGSEDLENMLVVSEGENKILLQLRGLQGHVMYEEVVELDVRVQWDY